MSDLGLPNLQGKVVEIVANNSGSLELRIEGDPKREVLAMLPTPGAGQKLSKAAFSACARRVEHRYDLAIDEVERSGGRS